MGEKGTVSSNMGRKTRAAGSRYLSNSLYTRQEKPPLWSSLSHEKLCRIVSMRLAGDEFEYRMANNRHKRNLPRKPKEEQSSIPRESCLKLRALEGAPEGAPLLPPSHGPSARKRPATVGTLNYNLVLPLQAFLFCLLGERWCGGVSPSIVCRKIRPDPDEND